MTIKEAVYREIRFGLCGSGGALDGLVSGTKVKLDMRNTVTSTESDYPFILFRRVTSSEDNQVNYAREQIELQVIGLRASATKGDSLLEEIREAILDEWMGTHKTFGAYTANGVADPTGGLRLRCQYLSTEEGFDADLQEKAHVLNFSFTYLRE